MDGWEETTIDNGKSVHGQEVTLVVLKIVTASHGLLSRIRSRMNAGVTQEF